MVYLYVQWQVLKVCFIKMISSSCDVVEQKLMLSMIVRDRQGANYTGTVRIKIKTLPSECLSMIFLTFI